MQLNIWNFLFSIRGPNGKYFKDFKIFDLIWIWWIWLEWPYCLKVYKSLCKFHNYWRGWLWGYFNKNLTQFNLTSGFSVYMSSHIHALYSCIHKWIFICTYKNIYDTFIYIPLFLHKLRPKVAIFRGFANYFSELLYGNHSYQY